MAIAGPNEMKKLMEVFHIDTVRYVKSIKLIAEINEPIKLEIVKLVTREEIEKLHKVIQLKDEG